MSVSKVRRWDLTALLVVAIVTAVGGLYRLWGLGWGLPNALHSATYHPDEIFQVSAMLKMNPFVFSVDPGFYNYPSGYMTLGSIIMRIALCYSSAFTSAGPFYLVARVVVAAMGIATIPIVYWVASKFYNKKVGYISALAMAIIPLHVVHSHFATVDVPTTMWVSLALLGSALILRRKGKFSYLLAGLFVGLATSTKYSAAVVILPVLVAHFLYEDKSGFKQRLFDKRLLMLIGSTLLGFIIATPGVLVQPQAYLQGFLSEAAHMETGHGMVFVGKGPGWLDVLTNALGYGMGIVLFFMSLLGFSLAVVRRKREDWVLLSFVIPYFIMISMLEVRFARYAMPLLPVLAILVGRMIDEVREVLREHKVVALSVIWGALCVGIFAYTATYAAALDRLFLTKDTRTAAAEWFKNNATSGATVALPTVPWFYSPPLAPEMNGTTYRVDPGEVQSVVAQSRLSLLVNPSEDWDVSLLRSKTAKYTVISDYESEDKLRVRDRATLAYNDEVHQSYTVAAKFSNRVRILGFDFGPAIEYPHDMKYMSPTLTVYQRR